MRVCLVSQEFPPETAHGGIGTQTWTKAQALASLGHDVEVVTAGADGRSSTVRTDDGVTVHRIATPDVQTEAAYLVAYSFAVHQRLTELEAHRRFDLVNFPEYAGEGFAFQLDRMPWNSVPVVVQLHGPLAMFAERIGWPDREDDLHRVGSFVESTSIRLADGLMASSANIADFSAEYFGIPRERIVVVHCGVDTDAFRPLPDTRPARPTVLFVGNLAPSKGLSTVLEAVLLLRGRYPDILLRVAGKGEGEELLRDRVRDAGAEENVEHLGFIGDRSLLPALYASAHVFASPADHEVGVANVYVEAMACGCPVVAATTGGAPEAVVDGETGFLVPPRDVRATADALDRILADEPLRRRLAEGGRRRAEDYFAVDKYIGRVLDAYDRTIDLARRTPDVAGVAGAPA